MDQEDDVEVAADAIATKLTDFMIQGFTSREGRPPTAEEIEQLFDELTPERIAEMLGEKTEGKGDDHDDEDADEEDEDVDEEDEEEVDETKESTADIVGTEETKESTEKSTVIDASTFENNENKRQLTSSAVVDEMEDKRIRIE